MQVTWHSFDLRSGRRGPQLTVRALGRCSRIISTAIDTEVSVRIWAEENQMPVPGWEAGTEDGRTMLVALDADANEAILWGGMVIRRNTPNLLDQWVTLNLSTLEAYLGRRYVEDHTWVATDQATIFAGLVADAVADGVTFAVDAVSGFPRDRAYLRVEDKKVLAALQELAAVENGMEFTVELMWENDEHRRIIPTIRARERLGTASTTPEVTFTMPGNITGGSYLEDFSEEHGANTVVATSIGEGDVRPESTPAVATEELANGWAVYERRFSPSTSITVTETLDDHAADELEEVRGGLKELTIEVRLDQAPHPTTWSIGDDMAVSLTCPRFPARTDPDGAVIDGYSEVSRLIGYDLDFDANRLVPRLVPTS